MVADASVEAEVDSDGLELCPDVGVTESDGGRVDLSVVDTDRAEVADVVVAEELEGGLGADVVGSAVVGHGEGVTVGEKVVVGGPPQPRHVAAHTARNFA